MTLFFSSLVYAGNYGALNYGKGLYGIGQVVTTPASGGGSSGGGGGGATSSCTYNWKCTSWSPDECPVNGVQERVCINKGTCRGTDEMPDLKQACTYEHGEPLFDIFLNLPAEDKEICSGEKIGANVKLENYGKIELLDAYMTYWIIDENNSLIAESKDTRAVTNEKKFEIELKIPKPTREGNYRIYAQINYDENKTAVAGETFEVLSKEKCKELPRNISYLKYPFYGLMVIIVVLVIFFLVKILKSKFKITKRRPEKTISHTKYKNKIKESLKRIKSKHLAVFLSAFVFVEILFTLRNKITGFAIGGVNKISNLGVIWTALIIAMGLLALICRKKILEGLSKKYPKNSLRGLIKKKVYTDTGDYIGKVEEILLGKGKIDSLKIRLDKKQKFRVKGIIIKYKNVKCVGHIVIIDNVLEHLNDSHQNL